MTLGQWIELNTGIEGNSNDVPVHVQSRIYSTISEGRATFNRAGPPKTLELVPVASGWAFVNYSGRAPNSSGGASPPFADASPRILSEQGGVSSMGCSLPSAGPPSKLVEMQRGSFNAETLDLLTSMRRLEQGDRCGEAAWLVLHQTLLAFTSGNNSEYAPYAFVSLRHVILREASAESKTIVMTGRSEQSWQSEPGSENSCFCLLLGDGRFQSLEAPHIELRFESLADFKAWSAALSEVCYDDPGLRQPKQVDMKMPAFDGTTPAVDPVELHVPKEPAEKKAK